MTHSSPAPEPPLHRVRSAPESASTSPAGSSPPTSAAGRAARTVASVLGVFAGVSGLDHGFFETLQGNTPTPGLIVAAIGPAQRMWRYGTEEAFTLVPNFLATGILACAVGLAVILWSVRGIGQKHGSAVFLALGVLLFLVGGGVAQVVFVGLCWAVARRLGRPPCRRRWILRGATVRALAALWPLAIIGATALGIFALEIAICGFVPAVTDPDRVQVVCWSSLGLMLVFVWLAVLGALAHDGEREASQPPPEAF